MAGGRARRSNKSSAAAGSSSSASGPSSSSSAESSKADNTSTTPPVPKLPITSIARIMRKELPENVKISDDSKKFVQESVSEFVNFITSEANDHRVEQQRSILSGDDIIYAMATLGFTNYVEPLKVYLQKYRENQIVRNSVGRGSDIIVEPPPSPSPPRTRTTAETNDDPAAGGSKGTGSSAAGSAWSVSKKAKLG